MQPIEPEKFLTLSVERRELADYIALYSILSTTSEILEILKGGYVPPTPTPKDIEVTLISPEGEDSLLDFGTKVVSVREGDKITPNSGGEDYTLTDFYTNETLTDAFDYQTTPITSPITLYVKGNAMTLSANKTTRLNGKENDITEAYFVLNGQEPNDAPIESWDASDGVNAVTAKMYEGGELYFVAREGATHIWCPDATQLVASTPNLTKVDGFKNLYGVKNLYGAFFADGAITDLGDFAELDVSNVENMSKMFTNAGMPTTLNLSSWDVSKCKNFEAAFGQITTPTVFTAENWTIAEGAVIKAMFVGVQNKKNHGYMEINVPGWTFEGENYIAQFLFAQQGQIESIDITGWDFSKFGSVASMFAADWNLQEVILGENNYINLPNVDTTTTDAFGGIYFLFNACYKLDTFNETGNEKLDHTLFVRIPNRTTLNNTNAFTGMGMSSTRDWWLDFDLVDEAYEGNETVSLVSPFTAAFQQIGAVQLKCFGSYNEKWGGATLPNTHTNLVEANSSNQSMRIGNQFNVTNPSDGQTYAPRLKNIIADRFIYKTNQVAAYPVLEWVLVAPEINEEFQFFQPNIQSGTSLNNFQLKGYYDGGSYGASEREWSNTYSVIATPEVVGYLTSNIDYIP